jgi:protein SCO1/2
MAPLGTGWRGNAADAGDTEAEPMTMGDPELDVLWIDEKNGEYIPLDTVFRDENGDTVTLAQLIDKPTVILPIYFYCPSSCSLNLVNLATAIKRSRLKPGTDYEVIAFSFNEEENIEDAGRAKKNYLRLLPQEFPEEKWKFLTGTKESIESLTQAIGYTFKPLSDGTFIHPSALLVVAADGMIIKYVYGTFATGDVDMAITEAKRGTPAVSIKRFLNYCFNYDPRKSRSFFQNVKISVAFGFAAIGICFIFYLRKTGRKK